MISTKPGLARFLRVTAGGLLRADEGAINAEERLDGKYLLRSSDPTVSAEDFALGYKQVLEIECGWRDMKQVLDLRPACHRRQQDRIRAHVVPCWLALLLVRVMETSCEESWPSQRRELQRMQLGSSRELPPAQRDHGRAARHPREAEAQRAAAAPGAHAGDQLKLQTPLGA